MAITYKYVHVRRDDGVLRNAPYIVIQARNSKGKWIDFIALLDSGADTTVLSNELAIFLDLKQSKMERKTGGIGGSMKARDAKFTFRVKGEHEKYNFTVDALVLQEEEDENVDLPPVLLGRNGFFEEFHITFRQAEEKVSLKKVNPNKHSKRVK